MNVIKNIISFFKKLFNKNDIKMIEAPLQIVNSEEKNDFINSLKVNISQRIKKKVETLTCFGDGLGIQTKMKY